VEPSQLNLTIEKLAMEAQQAAAVKNYEERSSSMSKRSI